MTPFEQAIAAHRAVLDGVEQKAHAELLRAYSALYARLRSRLKSLTDLIQAERAAGRDPKPAWLYSQIRYSELLQQTEVELREFALIADDAITAAQRAALNLAQGNAHDLMQLALGPAPQAAVAEITATFGPLQAHAFETLVGHASTGQPLGRLLAAIVPGSVDQAKDALAYGVATGKNPRETARLFRQATDVPLHRAMTIARTETLKAYTAASQETYRNNSHVVDTWVWHAALDKRTCAACFAMHGTEHDHDEILDRHPNCRCSAVPRTRSWAELGFDGIPDSRPEIAAGEDVFAGLSEADKLAVLGRGKLDAYNDGKITLTDLVARPHDPEWGTMRREKSLKEALA